MIEFFEEPVMMTMKEEKEEFKEDHLYDDGNV